MAAKKTAKKTASGTPYVVVRSRDAGVHAGWLVSHDGHGTVDLRDSRRIWRWRGARTLSEVSQTGIGSAAFNGYTRVAEPVPTATIIGACEILVCTPLARATIESAGWAP